MIRMALAAMAALTLAACNRPAVDAADPWAGTGGGTGNEHTGCAAMFIADNTSIYWQCKSGYKTSTQTTVTSVPYVVGNFDVFHVCVTTTGAVQFRINGTWFFMVFN